MYLCICIYKCTLLKRVGIHSRCYCQSSIHREKIGFPHFLIKFSFSQRDFGILVDSYFPLSSFNFISYIATIFVSVRFCPTLLSQVAIDTNSILFLNFLQSIFYSTMKYCYGFSETLENFNLRSKHSRGPTSQTTLFTYHFPFRGKWRRGLPNQNSPIMQNLVTLLFKSGKPKCNQDCEILFLQCL